MWIFPHTVPQAQVVMCLSRGCDQVKVIAEISGVSVRQVQRCLVEMEKEGFVISTTSWSRMGVDARWLTKCADVWELFLLPRAVSVVSNEIHRFPTMDARLKAFCMVRA